MKFIAAFTTAMAFATAMATPWSEHATDSTIAALEQRQNPTPHKGITVFYSQRNDTDSVKVRYRIMGFLRASDGVMDAIKYKMNIAEAPEPVERAWVISRAYFSHFRSWLSINLPGGDLSSLRPLFTKGANSSADVAWEGTIGVQFEASMNEKTSRWFLQLLNSYLTPYGNETVTVALTSVPDAFAIGSLSEVFANLKTTGGDTCTDTVDLSPLFKSQVPAIPDLFSKGC